MVVRCVECGELSLVATEQNCVCTRCGMQYPVIDDIPVLLESSLRSADASQVLAAKDTTVASDLRTQVAAANRQVYDEMGLARYADIHHNEASHQSRQSVEALAADLRAQAPDAVRLVDLGAGDCRLAAAATSHFSEVVAVDLSVRMLRESQLAEDDGVIRLCASADRTPLDSDSVDVVTATAMLHHIADLPRLMTEAYRILRPGGLLFTTHDPNRRLVKAYATIRRWLRRRPGGWIGGASGELAEYQTTQHGGLCPTELTRALRSAGFSPVRVRGYVTPADLSSPLDRHARRLLRVANIVAPTLAATHIQATARKPRA